MATDIPTLWMSLVHLRSVLGRRAAGGRNPRETRTAGSRAVRFGAVLILAGLLPLTSGSAAARDWADVSPPLGTAPWRIGQDPTNPQRIFLGSWGEGLYRSEDGGITWTQDLIDFASDEGMASDLVVEAELDPSGLLGVAITISGSYHSGDGGINWSRHPDNNQGLSPASGYMIQRIPDGSGIVASELSIGNQNGVVWIYQWASDAWRVATPSLQNSSGASCLGLGFDTSDPPVLHIGTTARNYWSNDLGASLHSNSLGLPDNNTSVIVGDPQIPGRVLAAVYGGIYLQTTPGSVWIPHGTPVLSNVQALIHHPAFPDWMFAGTNDGIFESHDRGATWTPMSTDGLDYDKVADLAIHPLRPNLLYASMALSSAPTAGGLYCRELYAASVTGLDDSRQPLAGGLLVNVFPNPSSGHVGIEYAAGTRMAAGSVRVGVYDVRGCRVRDLGAWWAAPETGRLLWDARDDSGSEVADGLYFLRLRTTEGITATRRMTICR